MNNANHNEPGRISFDLETIQVPLENLLPTRIIKEPAAVTRYKAIKVSIQELKCLVEPLMVYPQKDSPGRYAILDGHLRWHALKELGHRVASSIVSADDECFTFNARVSRLTPIQEHRMMVKAVNSGVTPERIAAALDMPLKVVKAFMNLLSGIHEEVADLLKDKNIAPASIKLLRKVSAIRQIEIAELMVSSGNYSHSYVEAMVSRTPADQLATPIVCKKPKVMSAEHVAKLEEEMVLLEKNFKAAEADYGQNVLQLKLATAYIRKVVGTASVAEFLKVH